MVVLLDRKSTKAALPDVAGTVIALVVTAYVSCQQPHHVVAQVTVQPWPEGEMKVTGQEVVSQQVDGSPLAGLLQERDEGGRVAVLVKDSAASTVPIEASEKYDVPVRPPRHLSRRP
jgi:hypothetical protein